VTVTDTEMDTDVPPDAAAHTCEHCGRPFADEEYLALHRGLDHPADLSATERAAFDDAREREAEKLQRFRLLALGALVVLYFGFLMTYAVVT